MISTLLKFQPPITITKHDLKHKQNKRLEISYLFKYL